MNIFKKIFGFIWAIWGLILFAVTSLIVWVPLAFTNSQPEPKRTYTFIHIARWWMGLYLPLIGCPLRIKGRENFKAGENYVVVCNHNSLMDVPVSYPGIPGGNKTIAKAEMAKTPVFGIIYQRGSVLVDRKNDSSRKESFLKMRAVLDLGLHMCIYPEGTRNKTKEPLTQFHDGAFKLSIDSGKSIIPALMFYTKTVLPADKGFYLWPHRLHFHFLPPVSPNGETVQSLRQKVFDQMKEYYTTHQP
jgi:1-acyl-sn-glycerol-3-phosphate acyltransferase